MMTKLKLLKEYDLNGEILPIDSIIEIDDEALIQELIGDGIAIAYTEDVELSEELEAIKSEAKKLKTNEENTPETKEINMTKETKSFGDTIKNVIETKAVDSYTSTIATNPLGIVSLDSGIFNKISKRPIDGSTLNIVYSDTQTTSADIPVIDIVGESTAAATSTPLTQYNAIAAKWFATVAIPNEYMDDVNGMQNFVSEEIQNKAELVLENSILNGPFTSNKGLKGILQSTDTLSAEAVALSAITVTELHKVVDSVIPECQRNAEWVINPATWAQLKGALLDADNLGFQLIKDGSTKELLGYPVTVSICMPAATPIVFGDFSKYIIGVARGLNIESDSSAAFLTDCQVVKISTRLAGGPACKKVKYGNDEYAAFVLLKNA